MLDWDYDKICASQLCLSYYWLLIVHLLKLGRQIIAKVNQQSFRSIVLNVGVEPAIILFQVQLSYHYTKLILPERKNKQTKN